MTERDAHSVSHSNGTHDASTAHSNATYSISSSTTRDAPHTRSTSNFRTNFILRLHNTAPASQHSGYNLSLKEALSKLLTDKIDLQKLIRFVCNYGCSSDYRTLLWKLRLGVLSTLSETWQYVNEQHASLYNDRLEALRLLFPPTTVTADNSIEHQSKTPQYTTIITATGSLTEVNTPATASANNSPLVFTRTLTAPTHSSATAVRHAATDESATIHTIVPSTTSPTTSFAYFHHDPHCHSDSCAEHCVRASQLLMMTSYFYCNNNYGTATHAQMSSTRNTLQQLSPIAKLVVHICTRDDDALNIFLHYVTLLFGTAAQFACRPHTSTHSLSHLMCHFPVHTLSHAINQYVHTRTAQLWTLLKQHVPQLHAHLQSSQVSVQPLCYTWFTVAVYALRWDDAENVWDIMILSSAASGTAGATTCSSPSFASSDYVTYIVLSLFMQHKQKLLSCSTADILAHTLEQLMHDTYSNSSAAHSLLKHTRELYLQSHSHLHYSHTQ